MKLPHHTLVEVLPRHANGAIEIRRPKFSDDAEAVLEGLILASYRTLCMAIRDPRVQMPHLKVLANLTEKLSYETGTSWPACRTVAVEEGLGEQNVENILYELRKWLYVHWERGPIPDNHTARGLHYTLRVVSVTDDDRRAAIEQWCDEHKRKVHLPGCTITPPYKAHPPGWRIRLKVHLRG
jgi:hypothetical protein